MTNKTIYFLSEYRWLQGLLLSVGKVNYKILVTRPGFAQQTLYVKKEKCAFEDELVCIVWETKKGKNGRGSYRVERVLYPQVRVPAQLVGSCFSDQVGRIDE